LFFLWIKTAAGEELCFPMPLSLLRWLEVIKSNFGELATTVF